MVDAPGVRAAIVREMLTPSLEAPASRALSTVQA
jgi:hypothetical protein